MPSTTLGSSHLRLVTTIIYLTTITTTTTIDFDITAHPPLPPPHTPSESKLILILKMVLFKM